MCCSSSSSLVDVSSTRPLQTVSIQTTSKKTIQSKSINQSLVQLLVHLLSKLVKKTNHHSLEELLNVARQRKDSQQIGDGTVHLARLLIKVERLSDECKSQIEEIVKKFEENSAEDQMK